MQFRTLKSNKDDHAVIRLYFHHTNVTNFKKNCFCHLTKNTVSTSRSGAIKEKTFFLVLPFPSVRTIYSKPIDRQLVRNGFSQATFFLLESMSCRIRTIWSGHLTYEENRPVTWAIIYSLCRPRYHWHVLP